eukprot:403341467
MSEEGSQVEKYLRTDSMPETLSRNHSQRSSSSCSQYIRMNESRQRYSDHSQFVSTFENNGQPGKKEGPPLFKTEKQTLQRPILLKRVHQRNDYLQQHGSSQARPTYQFEKFQNKDQTEEHKSFKCSNIFQNPTIQNLGEGLLLKYDSNNILSKGMSTDQQSNAHSPLNKNSSEINFPNRLRLIRNQCNVNKLSIQDTMMTVDKSTNISHASQNTYKDDYRSLKSLQFREKRRYCKKLVQDREIMKNRNRQEAAKKRTRDNNGKFAGGILLRKPQQIFKIEKEIQIQTTSMSNFNRAQIAKDHTRQQDQRKYLITSNEQQNECPPRNFVQKSQYYNQNKMHVTNDIDFSVLTLNDDSLTLSHNDMLDLCNPAGDLSIDVSNGQLKQGNQNVPNELSQNETQLQQSQDLYDLIFQSSKSQCEKRSRESHVRSNSSEVLYVPEHMEYSLHGED